MRKEKPKNVVVKKRLTAKEQVEQIRSKRLIKALANFCIKRTELYPN